MSFVVIVESGFHRRVYGPYRSFKKASADAKEWGGTVSPVEKPNTAENPWDAAFLD